MLSDQQKKFADLYIATSNAKQSYIDAGYKAKGNAAEASASRLLRNVKVSTFIAERMKSKDNERIASQDEVLEYLTQVMRGQITEQVPVVGEQGIELVDAQARIRERNKAAELLGKRYTLWVDKQQIEGGMVIFKGEDNLAD